MFGHKKRTVGVIKLWDNLLSNYLKRNDSMYGDMRQANYYMDLKGFYSGEDNVTFMYTIDGYPSELELSYRSTLRDVCKDGVRISFISTFEKHQILWNSPQMQSKFRTWKILEAEQGEVDEYNLHSNLALLDSTQWRKDSLTYLSEAEIRRKRKTFKFRSVMFVSGKRGDEFNDTIKELTTLCKKINIKITRVMGNIQDYLSVFSPFELKLDDNVLKLVGSNVLTDEILARFGTYSQGMVGKEGVYWGTDIYSGFPCLKPVKRTTETAETWLFTAEIGGGKSYFVKGICFQLLADRKYNGTIMDIEGFEYLPLAVYLSGYSEVVVLNMAEGQGAYFDPVEIIVTGDESIDKDMYSLSSSFTLSIFKTLLGDTGEDEWVDIVINDAISLTYSKRGVIMEDINSWKLSKGLTLFDVYSTLKDLTVDSDVNRAISNKYKLSRYQQREGIGAGNISQNDVSSLVTSNEGYQKAIEMCLAKISRYFEPTGIRASLFRKRIAVDDIMHAKLVVCSFGMAGKSEANVDKIQMSLMQLCTANISYIRSIYSKLAGKYNFKLWEEFQRWGGFPDADKIVSTAITGGRKLGDINIIVTNKVGDILDDDKFGVFSNITSFAIGAIGDAKVREDLCSRLTIPHMQSEIDNIYAKSADLASFVDGDAALSNPYYKSFLIGLDKTVYSIARMSLPSELSSSDIFRTGISLNIEDIQQELEDNGHGLNEQGIPMYLSEQEGEVTYDE